MSGRQVSRRDVPSLGSQITSGTTKSQLLSQLRSLFSKIAGLIEIVKRFASMVNVLCYQRSFGYMERSCKILLSSNFGDLSARPNCCKRSRCESSYCCRSTQQSLTERRQNCLFIGISVHCLVDELATRKMTNYSLDSLPFICI